MALPPTVDDIKSWSKVDFFSLDSPVSDSDIATYLQWSIDYIASTTGTVVDGRLQPPTSSLAQQAVLMRVEQLAMHSQPDYVETGSDDIIQSFSAGGYTETRHEGGMRITRSGYMAGYPLVNQWGALNEILWQLMDDDHYDYWRQVLNAQNAPAFGTTEVDWSRGGGYGGYDSGGRGGYGLGGLPLDPFPAMTDITER